MITNSTLIDNSLDALKMLSVVGDLIDSQECNMLKIATGYWDIPGTALLLDHLKRFLQRENTKVQILIGSDPVVRASQQKNVKYKGAITQTDFIRCDLQKLEVKDEYVETVKLLKEFCLSDFDKRRSAMNEAAIVPHICFRQKPSVLAYILFSPSKNLSANVGLSEIERLRKREAIIGT